jgi:preprotein translocase subunit SecA
VTKVLMTVQVQSAEQLDEAAEALESRAENITNVTYTAPTETGEVETTVDEASQRKSPLLAENALPRVGRNDPCPCGSGKKYKLCHGKLT